MYSIAKKRFGFRCCQVTGELIETPYIKAILPFLTTVINNNGNYQLSGPCNLEITRVFSVYNVLTKM